MDVFNQDTRNYNCVLSAKVHCDFCHCELDEDQIIFNDKLMQKAIQFHWNHTFSCHCLKKNTYGRTGQWLSINTSYEMNSINFCFLMSVFFKSCFPCPCILNLLFYFFLFLFLSSPHSAMLLVILSSFWLDQRNFKATSKYLPSATGGVSHVCICLFDSLKSFGFVGCVGNRQLCSALHCSVSSWRSAWGDRC